MAAERIQESECTFKPCINPYPAHPADPAHPSHSAGTGARGSEGFRGADKGEERRYNADLTPVSWIDCPLTRQDGGGERNGHEEEEDSLDPICHYWQPEGEAGRGAVGAGRSGTGTGGTGLRSRQLDGRHHEQFKQCTVNMREPERMARNIRLKEKEKEERRREERVAREIEEMKECTFHPSISSHSHNASTRHAGQTSIQAPVVVRGLGRHLELRQLSVRQREEAERREREVFSVRRIEEFRRVEDGSTIVKVRASLFGPTSIHSRIA